VVFVKGDSIQHRLTLWKRRNGASLGTRGSADASCPTPHVTSCRHRGWRVLDDLETRVCSHRREQGVIADEVRFAPLAQDRGRARC